LSNSLNASLSPTGEKSFRVSSIVIHPGSPSRSGLNDAASNARLLPSRRWAAGDAKDAREKMFLSHLIIFSSFADACDTVPPRPNETRFEGANAHAAWKATGPSYRSGAARWLSVAMAISALRFR
jgi:hypothetical protein